MSTTSDTPSGAATPFPATAAAGATAVDPGIPSSPASQHAVQRPEPAAATGPTTDGRPGTAPSPRSQSRGSQQAQEAVPPLPVPRYLDPNWIKEGVPDTQFYKDYPPDAWGQEASPNARVWKIYRDEMTHADAETLESWNGTLDVLLIFAGLFSAVSTAFIIESYKSLQPDYTQYVANFLYEAARTNAALNGALEPSIAGSLGPPDSYVHPSTTQRWTNGLWFTSLVISLTVALLSIMIKQWLDEYRARTTRSAPSLRAWAHRHQIYYPGLNRWGVPALISLLPLLLHVSLFLFFTGLVLFLRPLDGAIADTLLGILAFTLLFYVLSLVLPSWCIDCPSYTPLLAQARSLITCGLKLLLHFSKVVLVRADSDSLDSTSGRVLRWLNELFIRSKQRFSRETNTISVQQFDLDGRAITTLLVSTNDPDIVDAGVEAIGAISAESTLEVVVRDVPKNVIDDRTLRDFLNTGATSSAFAITTDARRVRTMLSLAMIRTRPDDPYAPLLYCHPAVDLTDLYPFLGLEGTMIQLMVANSSEDCFRRLVASFRERLSVHVLERIFQMESHQISRPTQPTMHAQSNSALNRATCLMFLRRMHTKASLFFLQEHHRACFLLAFCASDFAQAESHERALALRFVLGAFDRDLSTRSHDALKTLDSLFAILANHVVLPDEETARSFVHHLGLVSQSMTTLTQPIQWEQITNLAAFAQSPTFERYASRTAIEVYMTLLQGVIPPFGKEEESIQQYRACIATLLKLRCNPGLSSGTESFSVPLALFNYAARILGLSLVLRGRHFLERTSDNVLLKLLQTAGTLASRVGEPVFMWHESAEVLSCLLCSRQRFQPLSAGLVECFFTGPLLTNQFHDMMVSSLWPNRRRILRLAKHCARLSLDDMLRICDELEAPTDGRAALGEDELAVVRDIRRKLQPCGDLLEECDPSCGCMLQPEVQLPAEPTTPTTRWRNRILASRIAGPSESAV